MPTLTATPLATGTLVDPTVVLSRPPKVLDDEPVDDQPSRPRPPRPRTDSGWFSGSPGVADPNEACDIEFYKALVGPLGNEREVTMAFSRNCPQLN